MSMTIFDKILAGNVPADIVYEDAQVLAFHDIHPQAPVHVLVIPKNKINRFADIADWDEKYAGHFFKCLAVVAEKLNLNDTGYRIVINNGKDGGQEVEFFHAHILGGRGMNWPPG